MAGNPRAPYQEAERTLKEKRTYITKLSKSMQQSISSN